MQDRHGEIALQSVQRWFEQAVLGLNLCPFAHKPQHEGRIEFIVSDADSDEACLSELYLNCLKLDQHTEIETLVMICARHLSHFEAYNRFLDLADGLLIQEGWEGIYQLASFHPDYVFTDTQPDARANWTNRSPYPLLHLIREESVTRAVEAHPDVDSIPQTNIKMLNQLSESRMQQIFPGYRSSTIKRETKKMPD